MAREPEGYVGEGSQGLDRGFGVLLRRYRLTAGLTQDTLAERAGLSVRGIADLERGARRYPYRETIQRLAEALGLNADERVALTATGRRPGVQPPVKKPTAFTPRRNLPAHILTLIGREDAIRTTRQLLLQGEKGLVTLTGAGGSGKTRLAIAVAEELVDEFPDGVWLVELAPLSDPDLVPAAVVAALGLHELEGTSSVETLRRVLKNASVLVVLDNCEHLVEACAHLADELLRACRGLRILATSREPLHIAGELTWRVPTLKVPDLCPLPAIADLAEAAAVRLFTDRARAVEPSFQLTQDNGPPIAGICAELDGLPLAIELAAAWVRVLAPAQILERLRDMLTLLVGGARTAPTRQQTLRAALDWSLRLLQGAERRLFADLGVFAGGFDLPAAEAVCSGPVVPADQVFMVLSRLIDRSLVVAQPDREGMRYRLLEPVRQFARSGFDEESESDLLRRRHAEYFLTVAEKGRSALISSGQSVALQRLQHEQDNFRTALAWTVECGEPEMGLRIAAALSSFWSIRGALSEGRQWLDPMLRAADRAPVPASVHAGALRGAAHLEFEQGDWQSAAEHFQRSLALDGESLDLPGVAESFRGLGAVAQARGDYSTATTLYERSITLWRELGDKTGLSSVLDDLGEVARHRGDYDRAAALDAEALALQREVGDSRGMAFSLNELANVARHQGDYLSGRAFATEALSLQRQLGELRGTGYSLNNLGLIAQATGEIDTAAHLYQEALTAFRQIGDRRGISVVLPGLSWVAYARGDFQQARELTDEAMRLHRDLGEDRAIAQRLDALGRLAQTTRDTREASSLHRESLIRFERIGDRAGVAAALDAFASLAALTGDPIRAVELFSAATALRELIHAAPNATSYALPSGTAIEDLRARLGEQAFDRAWQNARGLPLDEVITSVISRHETEATRSS